MIEKLECGYITSYIKDLLPEMDNYSHYKNKDIFRTLSAFELETISSYSPTNNLSQKERQLVYVLENMLSRGFPTICSTDLERDLSRIFRNDFDIQESTVQGAIKFNDSISNNRDKAEWIKSIISSLILSDHKFDPNKVFEEIEKQYNSENNITVSQEERKFYCKILPNILGLNISQLFEPQRKIETMLPANEAQNYFGQRVDFAIETVDVKVVIEIDGVQHFQDQVQMNLDNQRRNSLRNNGWKVIEITATEINEGLNEQNINELRHIIIDSEYLVRLNQNETITFSSLSDQYIHIPLLVARFQKVLLGALKKGYLSFHQESWSFCFVEEDVSYANFAIEDTKVWLSNFCSLYNVPLPEIQYRTEKILEDFNPNSNNEILFYITLKKKWSIKEKQNIREKVNCLAFIVTSRFYFDNNFKVNSITPFPYEINESKEKNLLFLLQSIFRKEDYWEGQIGDCKIFCVNGN